MASKAPKTIAIIGSAIAGPTLALQILSNSVLRSAFRLVLFDQAAAPGLEGHNEKNRSGASVGLFANGLYPLYRLGLEEVVRKRGYECGQLTTWSCDYAGGHERLNTQANAMWSHDIQTGVMYFERRALQSLLVEKVKELGGKVCWAKKAEGFEALTNGQTRVSFADGSDMAVDLLVGADGGYSSVRKFILGRRNTATSEERWLPRFMGLTGFYGVSAGTQAEGAMAKFSDSHLVWLDQGYLASGPCRDGKVRWDLVLPEKEPPSSSSPLKSIPESTTGAERWQSAIIPSQYPYNSTVDILRKHQNVFHPYSGTLGQLFSTADRIIRSPLRQRVWKQSEMQYGSAVLIGDAARLMMPTSGQGTGFAIEDATVLARELLQHPSSICEALEAYARAREPRSKKMAGMASFAAAASTSPGWFWKKLRYYSSKLQPDRLEARKSAKKDPWPFNERLDVESLPK
ncbi:hypothetical protein EDB81DRAFT_640028 [Dactylonectria macrodidyma]|uniref:FAD-binding domain-containing protein n=1 Tax=Dactylonectria macrodidyma TaxID=307937 RepID=A0A9P9JM98_9HYPO|nr:hypothetical protein EDB81DRAFT_640028 [Dactylonectria macrodidyma]